MKRTKKASSSTELTVNQQQKVLSLVNSVLVSRLQWSNQLGLSYNGARDLYQALGYKKQLTYADYYTQYRREDIAKVVVDKVPKGCWSNIPFIKDESGETESDFERAYDSMASKLQIYSVFLRLDKLLGLGDYAVLLMGLDDSVSLDQPVEGTPTLKYLQPYSCNAASILKYDEDTASERYGMPILYQIQIYNPSNAVSNNNNNFTTKTVMVHWHRIIHVVEDPLESLVFGTPRMEALFNRLKDIQKIAGSNAESFWRNASPGRVANMDKDVTIGPGDKEDLQTQFDEYDNHLRKWLRVRGVDIQELSTKISSPKEALEVQFNLISAVTGVPKRILLGAELGELASSQDEKAWNALLTDRMTNLCGPCILRPFIDRLLVFKILPEPTGGEYSIDWPQLSALGALDKATISSAKMEAFSKYLSAPGATDVFPLDVFFREILHLPEETIQEIESKMNGFQEEDNTPEEE